MPGDPAGSDVEHTPIGPARRLRGGLKVADGIRVLERDRLYALGGTTPLDGRLSWAPRRDARYQTSNCYLLKEDGRHLLVDTGVRADHTLLERQLARLVAPGETLNVFVTRPELDCVGNLGLLRDRYRVEAILAGGRPNPFDAFDFAGDQGSDPVARAPVVGDRRHATPAGFEIAAIRRVDAIGLGPRRTVRVVVPLLRFLPTYWLYDEATGALFTSDVFGHVDQATPDPVDGVLAAEETSAAGAALVRTSLLCKFWWLPGAVTADIVANLRAIFGELAPTIVAPSHGSVLVGRDVVQRHLDVLLGVLERCDPRHREVGRG